MPESDSITRGTELGPAEEYKSLREELLQAKKYVFERPLLIVAVAVAGSRALDTESLMVLLVLVAILLLFNFWFTVNRLASGARIAAYIQIEIEERSHGPWVGWETCLREYRIWLSNDREKKLKEVKVAINEAAVPDALMYYPPIYRLHIGLMALAVCLALILAAHDASLLSVTSALIVVSVSAWFFAYLRPHSPQIMRSLIERDRCIWERVFNEMQRKGMK